MGFMDKAKKLAEQAQQKLDEAQESFNQNASPQQTPDAAGVRYDEHGRPIQDEAPPAATAPPPSAEPATEASPEPPPPPTPAGDDEHQPRPVQASPVVGRSMSIGGILTAMVTPFDANGDVDEDATVRLMRHLLENGSDGLVVAGSTGEAATLTDEEKAQLWELAVSETPGDAFIVAGTGTYDTRHTVELTERAHEAGVDAMLVVTPYYVKPNRRGLHAHYEAAAAATDRPIILYNIPGRTALDMPNDLLAELAEIDNVQAVKQARYEDLAPIDGLDLLAGNDDVLARVLDMGGPAGSSSRRTWSGARCAG